MPKVSSVEIRPIDGLGKTKAFVTIEFDGLLKVSDFKIIEGKNGLFLGLPSKPSNKKDDQGKVKYFETVTIKEYRDEGSPGQEFFSKLQAGVINRYKEQVGSVSPNNKTQSKKPPSDDVDNCPF